MWYDVSAALARIEARGPATVATVATKHAESLPRYASVASVATVAACHVPEQGSPSAEPHADTVQQRIEARGPATVATVATKHAESLPRYASVASVATVAACHGPEQGSPSAEPHADTVQQRIEARGPATVATSATKHAETLPGSANVASVAEVAARHGPEQGSPSAEPHADTVQQWRCRLKQMEVEETTLRGQACIAAALTFISDGWAAKALALGWEENALFGLDLRAPWARLDRQGAAFAPFEVQAITEEAIYYSAQGRTPLRQLRRKRAATFATLLHLRNEVAIQHVL